MPVRRDSLSIALSVLAVAILALALIIRPQALPAGSARFASSLSANRSNRPVFGRTYSIDTISTPRSNGMLGRPLPVRAGEIIRITGWVVDPRTLGPVDHLLIRVDTGRPIALYDYRQDRPDIAQFLESPSAAASGFSGTIATNKLKPGKHTLSFAAVTGDRRTFVLPTTLTLSVAAD